MPYPLGPPYGALATGVCALEDCEGEIEVGKVLDGEVRLPFELAGGLPVDVFEVAENSGMPMVGGEAGSSVECGSAG